MENESREGAEVVYGEEECGRKTKGFMEEMGFPEGVMPLKELVECGIVRSTGFVWMKQKADYDHYFVGAKSRVRYGVEVTAFVERFRMKKMTGVKTRQALFWIPVVDMRIVHSPPSPTTILFSTPLGISKSFPLSAFSPHHHHDDDHHHLPSTTLHQ